jgi:ferredoxin
VCKFGAIHIENGVAVVDRTKCAGCGACAEECPKKIITLLPKDQRVMPACANQDKGARVMKICKVGCIGCMKCERECPAGAITVKDNLAAVDDTLCTKCGHCAEVCPRKIITILS